jgi:hypothetical protein
MNKNYISALAAAALLAGAGCQKSVTPKQLNETTANISNMVSNQNIKLLQEIKALNDKNTELKNLVESNYNSYTNSLFQLTNPPVTISSDPVVSGLSPVTPTNAYTPQQRLEKLKNLTDAIPVSKIKPIDHVVANLENLRTNLSAYSFEQRPMFTNNFILPFVENGAHVSSYQGDNGTETTIYIAQGKTNDVMIIKYDSSNSPRLFDGNNDVVIQVVNRGRTEKEASLLRESVDSLFLKTQTERYKTEATNPESTIITADFVKGSRLNPLSGHNDVLTRLAQENARYTFSGLDKQQFIKDYQTLQNVIGPSGRN